MYDERLDRIDDLDFEDVDIVIYHLEDLNLFVDNEGETINIHDYLTPSELYLYRHNARCIFWKHGLVIMIDGYNEVDFWGCSEDDPLWGYYLRRSENPENARCYL